MLPFLNSRHPALCDSDPAKPHLDAPNACVASNGGPAEFAALPLSLVVAVCHAPGVASVKIVAGNGKKTELIPCLGAAGREYWK